MARGKKLGEAPRLACLCIDREYVDSPVRVIGGRREGRELRRALREARPRDGERGLGRRGMRLGPSAARKASVGEDMVEVASTGAPKSELRRRKRLRKATCAGETHRGSPVVASRGRILRPLAINLKSLWLPYR